MSGPPPLLKVSYTALHSLACPYSSFLRYEGGIKGTSSQWMVRGTALHDALERFHLTHDAGLDFLLETYGKEFNRLLTEDDVFITFAQKKRMEAEGKEWLATYFTQLQDGKHSKHPLDVEKEFSLPLSGVILVGKIDKVEQDENGDLTVIDYKSGSKKPDPWFLDHNLQFSAYWWATKELYGKYPKKAVWHHLRTGELFETRRTEWDIDQLKTIISNAVKMRDNEMRSRIYHEEICRTCDYRGEICDNQTLEQEIISRR